MEVQPMEMLQVWRNYWDDNWSHGDHDFAIVDVLDDVIVSVLYRVEFRPSTISFGKTMTVVELADLLLPEEHGEEDS
jgi:hypothetical protein